MNRTILPASVSVLSTSIAAGQARPFVAIDDSIELAVFPLLEEQDANGLQHYIVRIRTLEAPDEVENLPFAVLRPSGTDDVARAAFRAWTGDSLEQVVPGSVLHYPDSRNERCMRAVEAGDVFMYNNH